MALAWAALLSMTLLLAQNTEVRQLKNFSGVHVATSFRAVVVKGDQNSVSIEADGLDLDKIETTIENGVLKLRRKQNKSWGWSKGSRYTVNLKVTYTGNLDFIKASSSGQMVVQDIIEGGKLTADVSSSGKLKFEANVGRLNLEASSSGSIAFDAVTSGRGDVDVSSSGRVEGSLTAGSLTTEASSSGKIMLRGRAGDFSGDASSSGKILLSDMEVGDADCEVSSGARIEVKVTGQMSGAASSGGQVTYYGNPTVSKVKQSSGGKIVKG